jgi:DNA-binding response OmpR family regulator
VSDLSERILVVEDEESIARILVDALESRGYRVTWLDRGDTAALHLTGSPDDLVLLDVMLPGCSGFDLLRQMRRQGNQTPVIMLTAKGTEPDRVLGFELGVDDYVTKPFSVLELLGRVKAVLRRHRPMAEPVAVSEPLTTERVTVGPASFDFRRLTVDGAVKAVALSAKGFAVLEALHAAGGGVVSRDDLIDRVWGSGEYINNRTIDNIIVRLRQLIERDPAEPRHLKTVYGVGYQLLAD